MGLNINIDKTIDLIGYKGKFLPSLVSILKYMSNDKNIKTIEQGAYMLATANIESGYSLQRWESDFSCGKTGVPYTSSPCDTALNYYKSTEGGKSNYYKSGVDSNGLPYFGRGMIQLSLKDNYRIYGGYIGVDLVKHPDLALVPINSYRIASKYMVTHKYLGKTTFQWVDAGNLTNARKSVNGGTRDLQAVNTSYKKWLSILNKTARVSDSNTTDVSLKVVGLTAFVVVLTYVAYKYYNNSKNTK